MSRGNILVAGGAGYIGSHACKMLQSQGYVPVVYDNMSGGHEWAVKWGPMEYGDVRDYESLVRVIRKHNPVAVMHFAAFIAAGESVIDPGKYYGNNVGGMVTLLSAMRDTGLRKIVFSSTAAIFSTNSTDPIDEHRQIAPENPYGSSKAMCEQLLTSFGIAHDIRAVALRYFNAAGADPDGELGEAHEPETHLIPLILEVAAGKRKEIMVFGDDYPTPDGSCIRDYIHICDLADAHVRSLEYLERDDVPAFSAFNLGNGNGFSVMEVIEAARDVTGHPIPAKVVDRRAGDPAILISDASKALNDLGWKPEFANLKTQIEHAWRWMKASM